MKHLKNWLLAIGVLALLYLVVNIGVLLWYWIDPDGFWGVVWFYTLASGLFYLFYIGLVVILAFFGKGKGWKRFLYGILIGVLAVVLMGVELLPVFFITKEFSDKNRYTEKSTKFFKQGRYEKAYEYSEELYATSLKDYDSKFWFLRYLFFQTSMGEELLKARQYEYKINYAFCLTRLGMRSLEAEQVFEKCEQIARNYFPDYPEYLLLSLGGRSNLYYSQGEIVKSERVYNEISGLLQEVKSEGRVFMVNTMLIRVLYLQRHGEYSKAHQTIQDALALYDLEDAPESGTFFQLAMISAQSYLLQGQYEEAREMIALAEPAADNRKKNLFYLSYLSLKARLLEQGGSVDEAEETYLELIDRGKDKSEVVYSKQLMQLAGFYYRQREFRKALPFLEKSMKLNADGESDARTKENQMQGLSLMKYALGNNKEAVRLMKSVDASVINAIDGYMGVLESGQKEKYVLKVQSHFSLANALYIASGNNRLSERIYNNVLFTKSLAFFSNRHVEDFISQTQSSRLKQRFSNIKKVKRNLQEGLLRNISARNESAGRIDSILLEERKFLDDLTTLHGYKPFRANEVNWEDVRASLDSSEVAVEFFHCRKNLLDPASDHYFALIVDPNSIRPEIVSLCSAKAIDELLKENGALKDHINSLYNGEQKKQLYDLIINPLAHKIKDKGSVYFSLSGILHQVSMPALTIDEPWEIRLLSSTRSLVDASEDVSEDRGRMVMMGDLDYESNVQRALEDSVENANGETRHYEVKKLAPYQDLPGTKKELTEIALLLDDKGISSDVFSREQGTEKAFRNIESMNTEILHLATHGFYYPQDNSVVMMDRLFGMDNFLMDIDNPMMRAGLLFSPEKGNEVVSSESDGVVTANEIAAMDFSGVELVVLSACQSGLGDVLGSEGVFGLQRAFKMAGAEKLIVSLWKVPDQATAELMVQFYDNYLNTYDVNSALRKAQKAVREKYPEPFFWAGFYVVN